MRLRIPLDPSDASTVNRFILQNLGTRYQLYFLFQRP
jgi:hypothetical protein